MNAQLKLPENARIISNSEVDAFNTCEKKHWFSFLLNLEPKHVSRSLNIGIIGHEIVAQYYRALKDGKSKQEAYQTAMKLLTQHMEATSDSDFEPLIMVQALFSRYVEQDTLAEGSEILEVEKDFYMPINNNFWYGMRLDLLVKSTRGRSAGNIYLVDHKFTYDFYGHDDLKLNPQSPKYIGVLRFNGIEADEGYLNQFRTRFPAHLIPKKTDEDLFKRDPVGITPARIRNAFRQQIIVSERIIERYRMSPELQEQEAVPVLNKMICRNCPFSVPCQMNEDGIPIDSLLKSNFRKRTYGYNSEEETT